MTRTTNKICEYCGKEFDPKHGYTSTTCSEKCFEETYWRDVLDEDALIIDGECYHDGGRKPENYEGFLGHAGKRFVIQKNDGTIIDTNNLWYNAIVPEDKFTGNNAIFLPLPNTPYEEDKTR